MEVTGRQTISIHVSMMDISYADLTQLLIALYDHREAPTVKKLYDVLNRERENLEVQ